MEKATLAMGCFWAPDKLFTETPGVTKTTVGYTGGTVTDPSYEQICSGTTGHAEAIEIEFDAERITYSDLLSLFWKHIEPTRADGQGPDIGSQYRPVIFYHNDTQRIIAEKTKDEEQKKYDKSIVVEITKVGMFYRAEEYHQKYYQKNPSYVCHF